MKRTSLVLALVLYASWVWAFPDNGVLETFTGTNGTSPPNANWTNGVMGAADKALEIQGNAVTTTDAPSTGDAYWDTTSFNAGCEAYATVVNQASLSFAYIFCRLANIGANTTDGYAATINATNDTLKLKRIDNGVETDIWGPGAQTIADGDSWGIRVSGNSVCHWYKTAAGSWTEKQCVTDSTYSAGGYIGLGTQGSITALIDSFGGGNVTVAATRRPVAPVILP